MRRLVGYMRPYRKLVGISLLFLIVQSALQVLGPLLTKIAVDSYIQPNPVRAVTSHGPSRPADAWTGLQRLGLLYLCVLAGSFVSEFAQTYLMQFTGQLAMFD